MRASGARNTFICFVIAILAFWTGFANVGNRKAGVCTFIPAMALCGPIKGIDTSIHAHGKARISAVVLCFRFETFTAGQQKGNYALFTFCRAVEQSKTIFAFALAIDQFFVLSTSDHALVVN